MIESTRLPVTILEQRDLTVWLGHPGRHIFTSFVMDAIKEMEAETSKDLEEMADDDRLTPNVLERVPKIKRLKNCLDVLAEYAAGENDIFHIKLT